MVRKNNAKNRIVLQKHDATSAKDIPINPKWMQVNV